MCLHGPAAEQVSPSDIGSQPLVAHRSVEQLDVRGLLRVTRLDELDVSAAVCGPIHGCFADVLRASVAANHRWLACIEPAQSAQVRLLI